MNNDFFLLCHFNKAILNHNIRREKGLFCHKISRVKEHFFRFYTGPSTDSRASLRSSSLLGNLSVDSNTAASVVS